MKIYFAGWEASGSLLGADVATKVTNVLTSYFYIRKKRDFLSRWISEGKNILLDSGAFSAWTANLTLDVREYMKFIRIYKQDIPNYISLDSIGDAGKSIENYNIMLEKGYKPIPCFHYNEDFKALDYYVSKSEYVGLGGMVGIDVRQKSKWLDKIFTKYPTTKFHGFGMTAYRLLFRYPWYSVDSTTWLQGGKLGKVMLPDGRVLDFSKKKEIHQNNLLRDKLIKKVFKALDVEEAHKNYKYRNEMNVLSFLEMEKQLTEHPPKFKNKQRSLFPCS